MLVLDMKRLDYISSAGLRVVFKAAKALRAVGGSVALANRQPHIVKVFEIVKALPDLQVFKNDQEMDEYLKAMQQKSRRGD
jgi:anti-sigma B factor antagonist